MYKNIELENYLNGPAAEEPAVLVNELALIELKDWLRLFILPLTDPPTGPAP